ncbi:hypothetical protein GCM10027047_36140 [Rhodococcus aerolatus]
MLATAGDPPTGPGWAAELKWDGVRAVARVHDGEVVLHSRTGRAVTGTYPEVVAALAASGLDVVLDGEVVTLDAAGRPSFSLLQQRMHVVTPTPDLVAAVPVSLQCFDVLAVDGRATTGLPLHERRALLDSLGLAGPGVTAAPAFDGVTPAELLAAATEQGLEGVVAKRLTSPYRPGARSRDWVKTAVRRTADVVVGGWTAGQGSRATAFGALLLGAHDAAGGLVYLGHVGTGFTAAHQAALRERLDTLARPTSPFAAVLPAAHRRGAQWVEPVLVGQVEHREQTSEGRFRHPSWRGLRPDVSPAEVLLPGADPT